MTVIRNFGLAAIVTSYDPPPIPLRKWDWHAYFHGFEDERMLIGYGPTEQAAVIDLLEQQVEREHDS